MIGFCPVSCVIDNLSPSPRLTAIEFRVSRSYNTVCIPPINIYLSQGFVFFPDVLAVLLSYATSVGQKRNLPVSHKFLA